VELRRWQTRQRTVSEEQCLVIVPRDLSSFPDGERADSYGDGDGRRARGGHGCAQEMEKSSQSHSAASFQSVGNGAASEGLVLRAGVLNDDVPPGTSVMGRTATGKQTGI
jgi:hypothetical protein